MGNIEKIVKRVLNEMNFKDMDEVIQFGEFAKLFSKSEMRLINVYLLKIRELGVVNMFQAGDFFLMSNEYFKDFMRLKSYERDFDEDEIEEISDLIEDVRNIMIAGAIRMIERDNRDVSVRSVKSAVRVLAQNTIKYYMTGVLNDRQ